MNPLQSVFESIRNTGFECKARARGLPARMLNQIKAVSDRLKRNTIRPGREARFAELSAKLLFQRQTLLDSFQLAQPHEKSKISKAPPRLGGPPPMTHANRERSRLSAWGRG